MTNEQGPGDEELEWLLAELADEAHFEARFADAQQRFTRIVTDSPTGESPQSSAAPSFDDPDMLALLLDLDPSLVNRLEPPDP